MRGSATRWPAVRLASWLRLVQEGGLRSGLGPCGVIALLALAERLLGPAVVQVATTMGAARGLCVGALLTLVAALRGVTQSAQVASTEAAVYIRVVDSVFRQDVLKPSVLPDEEARAALFDGAHDVARAVAEGLPNLFANLVAATTFAVVVALIQPARIVLVAAAAGAVSAASLVASRRVIEAAQQAEWSAWARLADGVNDAFEGRLEIVAGGRAASYGKIFSEIVSWWRSATMRAARVVRLASRLPLFAFAAIVCAAFVGDSILRGAPASRTLAQAALLASMSPPFIGIVQGLQDLVRSDRRAQQILALMTPAPLQSSRGAWRPGNVRSLDLRDVHFAYERSEGRHEVLRGVSFSWRAGEVLALAGTNGSGKSTCIRVLLGLGQRAAGDVLIDGVPLERIDVDLLRHNIAFLPQRPYLPPRSTVRRSLRFIDPDVTEETMVNALERVGLLAILGSDAGSPLDARVDELSVGQRQRIGVARVLCRNAPLVVLDEPDANLDRDGIHLVISIVRELARDRMILIAAHSSELLAAADRVITLHAGRVLSDDIRPSGRA